MRINGLTPALILIVSAAASAQGPKLPALSPQPVPPPPAAMLNAPVQQQVNEVPPVPVPTPANAYQAPQVQSPAVEESPAVAAPSLHAPQHQPQAVTPPNRVYEYEVESRTGHHYSLPRNDYYSSQQHYGNSYYTIPQQGYYQNYPIDGDGINPAGAEGIYVGPAHAGGLHQRFPYYDYRRPWYTRGQPSLNVNIVW